MTTEEIPLEELYDDLAHYKILTEAAHAAGDFHGAGFIHGQQYHRTASEIARRTGIDPRPKHDAISVEPCGIRECKHPKGPDQHA